MKPVTNQRSSGRCWVFACLNAMRIPFVKEMNLDDFEFSQGYLFFWDMVSTSNRTRGYFLVTVGIPVSKSYWKISRIECVDSFAIITNASSGLPQNRRLWGNSSNSRRLCLPYHNRFQMWIESIIQTFITSRFNLVIRWKELTKTDLKGWTAWADQKSINTLESLEIV